MCQHWQWAISLLSSPKNDPHHPPKNALTSKLDSSRVTHLCLLSIPTADGHNRGKYSETEYFGAPDKGELWRRTCYVNTVTHLSGIRHYCCCRGAALLRMLGRDEARLWQAPTLRELGADPGSWVTLIDGNWPPVVIVPVPLCHLMFRIKVGEPRKQRETG